jgi:hypothetical protein
VSYTDRIPETAHDRLGWLTRPKGVVMLFPPHPEVGELERMFRCTGCGMDIAVGPCFEHVDPKTFLGVVCGCRTVETLPCSSEPFDGAGKAGKSTGGGLRG